jgi:hypothetical protein
MGVGQFPPAEHGPKKSLKKKKPRVQAITGKVVENYNGEIIIYKHR